MMPTLLKHGRLSCRLLLMWHAGSLTITNNGTQICDGDGAEAWQTDLKDALDALHAGGALASCRLQAGKQLLHRLLAL